MFKLIMKSADNRRRLGRSIETEMIPILFLGQVGTRFYCLKGVHAPGSRVHLHEFADITDLTTSTDATVRFPSEQKRILILRIRQEMRLNKAIFVKLYAS